MNSEARREVEDALDEEVATAASESPLSAFVETLRTQSDDSLRLVVRYDGDEHDVLYTRDGVRADLDDETFDEQVKTLVMKGLSDPPEEQELSDFGSLHATLRWFDDVVVACYPTGEWTGVVATFDRGDSPFVGAALDQLE